MLAGISPLGERARGNSWWRTAVAYGVGHLAAGAALGAALGGIGALGGHGLGGSVPGGPWGLAVGAAVAVLAGLADLLAPGRLPTLHRQVNEAWLARYRGWVYGVGFGAQLGAGAVTIVATATVYAWMVAAVLAGSPGAGAVVGAVFGTTRALPLLLVSRVGTPAELRAVLRRLSGRAALGHATAAAASLAVGAGWAAAAVGRL